MPVATRKRRSELDQLASDDATRRKRPRRDPEVIIRRHSEVVTIKRDADVAVKREVVEDGEASDGGLREPRTPENEQDDEEKEAHDEQRQRDPLTYQ